MRSGIPTELPEGCEKACPGCRYRGISAQESRERKEGFLRRLLESWADRLEPLREAVPERRWGYRERVCLRAEWRDGAWVFGFRDRDDRVIPIPGCPIHSARVRAALWALSRVLPGPPGFPMIYAVVAGTVATAVIKAREWPDEELLSACAMSVREALSPLGVEAFWLNLSPSAGERVFASKGWRRLWGPERVRLELPLAGLAAPGAASFEHGPSAFQQLLPELYRDALEEAAEFLDPKPGDAVLDLYSGVGVSLRLWKARGAQAMGVELGGEAVACAKANVGSDSLLQGRTSDRIPQLTEWAIRQGARERGGSDRLLVFANPPRLGLEPEVSRWLAHGIRPRRIAYLSCSAGTLQRDLQALCAGGYSVTRMIPYDFFPQTPHVETLVLLHAV